MVETPTTETERRSSTRRPYHVPVRIHVRGPDYTDSFVLHAADVSDGGLFLRSDWLFDHGERLDLEFEAEGGERQRRLGRVVRVVASPQPRASGMAVGLADRFWTSGDAGDACVA
ncbi:MAG: PilZ domain-containing protein [Proteobacteria bacterium]|nr:PilZ domain-containing protein [Pseudomonadota bacterium]